MGEDVYMNSRDVLSESVYVRLEVTGGKKTCCAHEIPDEWESTEREVFNWLVLFSPFWNILIVL